MICFMTSTNYKLQELAIVQNTLELTKELMSKILSQFNIWIF